MSDRLQSVSNLPFILRTRQLVFVAFPLLVTVALVAAAWRTGPWFDEFWSYYLADPSVGLRDAFLSKWTRDVHPPFFSFVSWIASQSGLPRTIEAGRMLNLLPLLASAAYSAAFWRLNPQERPFMATFLPGAIALAQFTSAFVEFRSYFTGLCAFVLLLLIVKRLDQRDTMPLVGANRLLVWAGQIVSLAICLNIHFVTALLAIALVGTFALAALWRGDRRLFAAHLLSGIACCLPLAATTAAQWLYLSTTSRNFWLKTTQQEALVFLFQSVMTPIGQGPVMRIAWIGALGLRILSRERRSADDRYAITLAISVVFAGLLILAYTAATGALTGRYLVPICMVVIAAMAALVGQALRSHGLLQILFLIACATSIVQASLEASRATQWNEAASFVAAKQKACPGGRIVPMRAVLEDATANVEANYAMAYAYLADLWQMRVGALDKMPAAPRDPACPDYYWIDNDFALQKAEPALKMELLRRFPQLSGCTIQTHKMVSDAVVFEVSGEPPQCSR